MRVLVVYKDFEPLNGAGGVPRYIHGMSEVLSSDLGIEVRVVAPPSGGVSPAKDASYHAEAVPIGKLRDAVAWSDVVHVHGSRSVYAHIAAWQARRLGKPFVFTPHCYYDHGNFMRRALKYVWDRSFERALVARASAFILLSDDWIDDVRKRGFSTKRAVIFPVPIFWRELSRNATETTALSGSPSVLSISRLDPVKRLDDVIRAMAVAPEMAAGHLHIVGKGPDEQRLRSIALELGVQDRIHFYGFQPDRDAMRMLCGADVFVLASEREGMPATLIEAVLVGTPVVATSILGNAAVLCPLGLEDHLVPLGDPKTLGAKLAAVATAGRVSPDIRRMAHERHTWEVGARTMAHLFTGAIARS